MPSISVVDTGIQMRPYVTVPATHGGKIYFIFFDAKNGVLVWNISENSYTHLSVTMPATPLHERAVLSRFDKKGSKVELNVLWADDSFIVHESILEVDLSELSVSITDVLTRDVGLPDTEGWLSFFYYPNKLVMFPNVEDLIIVDWIDGDSRTISDLGRILLRNYHVYPSNKGFVDLSDTSFLFGIHYSGEPLKRFDLSAGDWTNISYPSGTNAGGSPRPSIGNMAIFNKHSETWICGCNGAVRDTLNDILFINQDFAVSFRLDCTSITGWSDACDPFGGFQVLGKDTDGYLHMLVSYNRRLSETDPNKQNDIRLFYVIFDTSGNIISSTNIYSTTNYELLIPGQFASTWCTKALFDTVRKKVYLYLTEWDPNDNLWLKLGTLDVSDVNWNEVNKDLWILV